MKFNLVRRLRATAEHKHGGPSPEELQAVTEELQVHQLELETQNQELREARKKMEETVARYTDLYNFAPVAYVTVSPGGIILEMNLAAADILGIERNAAKGRPLAAWVSRDSAKFFNHLKRATAAHGKVVDDLRMQFSRRGAPRYVRLESVALRERDGRATACRTAIVDLTDRKLDEERLTLATQVFDRSADAMIITDHDNRIVWVNPAFSENTGYQADEVLGQTPKILASGRHDKAFYRDLWATLRREGFWSGEICNRKKDGELSTHWLTIHAVRNERGEIENCMAFYTEMTDQRALASRIQYLAHYDALTALPNRALLQDRISRTLTHAAREHSGAAVLFLDLDRFKTINDSLGHIVGDRLLQEVARRLKACVREDDTVSRRGGDEFIVVLNEVAHAERAANVAEKIIEAMAQHFDVDGHHLNVTFSIGISVYPADGEDAETLIRSADVAMYQAKQSGRNSFRFFTASMNAHALERLSLENDLHEALRHKQFVLVYQPQVDSESGQVVGTEALLRWRHPQWGLVEPTRFIPVAEESGLIVPIGTWVLKQACEQARRWRLDGLRQIGISVNISALQFHHRNLLTLVRRLLEDSHLVPESLELELTESVLMHDDEETLDTVRALHGLGVRLVIDDFGTGYSSLSYLRSFPIYKLKIDQSFVRDLTRSSDAGAITKAIIAMARSLNLKVVAEGVETSEQSAFLRSHHCDQSQGFYYSAPLSADEMADFIRLH